MGRHFLYENAHAVIRHNELLADAENLRTMRHLREARPSRADLLVCRARVAAARLGGAVRVWRRVASIRRPLPVTPAHG
jgi:hypothetical protein